MRDFDDVGRDWLDKAIKALPTKIVRRGIQEFNETHRYLPESVTPLPGYIRFDVNPFMIEILECFDVRSHVREVNLKKGVQITYTTLLESVFLYYAFEVRTVPCMYVTADRELSAARIENNFIPMIQDSGLSHLIASKDTSSKRKSGITKNHIQWLGGGYMVPFGAKSPSKARQFSILLMLMDELDGWPTSLGKDGDPNRLFTDRTSGYWLNRKVFRGSTPLLKNESLIDAQYLRGDQRKYMVLCRACSFPQELRWSGHNSDKRIDFGFKWDLDDGQLVHESVRYLCSNCGHEHFEHDKEKLFALDHGAHWKPTARPVEPDIRSYHLPALYSPIGMQPWYKSVGMFLEAYDPKERRVLSIDKFQVFYNNVLGKSFEVMGSKIHFTMVSAHRRSEYRLGEVPNLFAIEYAGGPILFLTCLVDVHKHFLAVAVLGWTRGPSMFLIEYKRFVDESEEGCLRPESSVWAELREVIEEQEWAANDGKKYRVQMTLIDAGYENDLVTTFCNEYETGVFPTLGRDRPAKNQKILEFAPFKTQAGTIGYRILVDHYKDRLAPVLRREWLPVNGPQKAYHFNAPIDTPDPALKELTKETRREIIDKKGHKSYEWYRPGNARNELWDLLVMGNAALEIIAWDISIRQFEREAVSWEEFWDYISDGIFFS